MTEKIEQTEDVEETVEDAEQKPAETKTLTQSEVNRLVARERKAWSAKYESLKSEHEALLKKIADAEQEAEDKAKEKVEGLRKGQPENVLKLLDKLSYTEQLEYLSDPANRIEKKVIPTLPNERPNQTQHPRIDRVI